MFGYAARNAILPQMSELRAVARLHRRRHAGHGDGLLLPGHRLRCLFRRSTPRTTRSCRACFLVITLSVLVANMLADVAYAVLDPRTRQEG